MFLKKGKIRGTNEAMAERQGMTSERERSGSANTLFYFYAGAD